MGLTVLQNKIIISQVVPGKLNLSKPLHNKLLSYMTITSVEGKIPPM